MLLLSVLSLLTKFCNRMASSSLLQLPLMHALLLRYALPEKRKESFTLFNDHAGSLQTSTVRALMDLLLDLKTVEEVACTCIANLDCSKDAATEFALKLFR